MVASAWGVLELTQNEPIANPGDTHANTPPIEVNAPLPVPGYTNEPVEPRTQPDLRALTHHRRPASSNLSCLGTPNWQIKVFVVRGVANSTLIPIIHNLAVSAPDLASANPGSSHPRVLPSEQS